MSETFLYLTTTGRRTGLPRRIEIWYVERGGLYYLVSEHRERSKWFRNLTADPLVRFSVGTRDDNESALPETPALARPLAHDAEASALMDAKYDWSDGLIVELTPVELAIAEEPLDGEAASMLISALNAELTAMYPEPGANHVSLDVDEVGPGRGRFVVAHLAGEPVACGAVRLLGDGRAELKRMYTSPAARGRRIARALLARLEREARALGATDLVLETGTRQTAAISLYEQAGFARIPPFGEYVDSPLSVTMGKTIAGP